MATDPELPVVPMENYLEITEASSAKLQASSRRIYTRRTRSDSLKPQAASFKPQAQAASVKLQAASDKLHNFFALIKFHATRSKVLR